ncbi:MAG: hypothetical protein RL128_518, partial [Pseudomonadota bacterium]
MGQGRELGDFCAAGVAYGVQDRWGGGDQDMLAQALGAEGAV